MQWHFQYTRGIQKVHRKTQLITRCVHHILLLFNIVFCNQNALGPAFLQSSDFFVEESLILLFQPAICYADNVFPSKLPPLHEGSAPLSNTCFLVPTQVHTINGISVDSSVFAGLKIVTDRPTDNATLSVAIGLVYVVVRCGSIISCAAL